MSDDYDAKKLRHQISEQILNHQKNLFWFEDHMDSYILIDGNYFYCFDMYYLDTIHCGQVTKYKFNFLKNFPQAKEIIKKTFSRPQNPDPDLFSLLNKYLKERIKTNNKILLEIVQKIEEDDSTEMNKFLKSFIGKYFDVKK